MCGADGEHGPFLPEILVGYEQPVYQAVIAPGTIIDDLMHHDWVGHLVEQHLGRSGLAVLAIPVHVFEIPAKNLNASANCV